MIALLLVLGVAAALLLPAWRTRVTRTYAVVFLCTLVLFLALRELPSAIPGERTLGSMHNWSGMLLATVGVLALARLLIAGAGFTWHEFGLTARQLPGTWRVVPAVVAILLANHALMTLSPFRLDEVSTETWVYQATMPGIAEEIVFRGVLLALADRIYTTRRDLLGAPIGFGGIVVTVLFFLLHGPTAANWFGLTLGVLPAALLYLWLRARSGSLVLPILAHNLWNVSVHAAHL